jgi:hypothetical protein
MDLGEAIKSAIKDAEPARQRAAAEGKTIREQYGEALFGDDGEFNAYEEETLP